MGVCQMNTRLPEDRCVQVTNIDERISDQELAEAYFANGQRLRVMARREQDMKKKRILADLANNEFAESRKLFLRLK